MILPANKGNVKAVLDTADYTQEDQNPSGGPSIQNIEAGHN
jgi:hypothetical protein